MTEQGTRRDPGVASFNFIYLLTVLVQILLALRFIFKLIGANTEAPITVFVYAVTDVLMWPFANLIAPVTWAGVTIDVVILIAMVVYALAGWLLGRILMLILRPSRRQEA